MSIKLGPTTVVVGDFDEAVEYYTKKLGFTLKEDRMLDKKTRVIVVAHKDNQDMTVTFLKKDACDRLGKLGLYAGSNTLQLRILETEDLRQTYAILKAKGVKFTGEPTEVPYGLEVSFEDLYGNEFDLVEIRY